MAKITDQVSVIKTHTFSSKLELFSGGKQVGRWVRKYFENWDLTPSVLSNIPINIPELKADHVVLMRFKYLTNFNKYLVNANSRMEELQIEIIDLMELELNK